MGKKYSQYWEKKYTLPTQIHFTVFYFRTGLALSHEEDQTGSQMVIFCLVIHLIDSRNLVTLEENVWDSTVKY